MNCKSCYDSALRCNIELQNHLNDNYSVNVFPNVGGDTLPITVYAVLTSFLSLTTDKVLDVVMSIILSWQDGNIPLPDSCGSSRQFVNTSLLWTPYMLLANPASGSTSFDYLEQSMLTPVRSGNNNSYMVTAYLYTELVSVCSTMALQDFPFDSQTCFMQVHLALPHNAMFESGSIGISAAMTSDEWLISSNNLGITTGSYLSNGLNYPAFNITISATRDSYFYKLSLVSPTVAITAMVSLVFVLPCDRGEKVMLSATLVLSLYVLLQTYGTLIPIIKEGEQPKLVRITTNVFYLSIMSLFNAVLIQTLCILAPELPVTLGRKFHAWICRSKAKCCHKMSWKFDGSVSSAAQKVTQLALHKMQAADIAVEERIALSLEELVHMKKAKQAKLTHSQEIDRAWYRFQYVYNFIFLIVYSALVAYTYLLNQTTVV